MTSRIPVPTFATLPRVNATVSSIIPTEYQFKMLFHEYAKFGRLQGYGGGIAAFNLSKWLQQANIIPHLLSKECFDIRFHEFAGCAKKSIEMCETIALLRTLAYMTDTNFAAFLVAMVACGYPNFNNTTDIVCSPAVDRLSTPVTFAQRAESAIKKSESRQTCCPERMNWPTELIHQYRCQLENEPMIKRQEIKRTLDMFRYASKQACDNHSLEYPSRSRRPNSACGGRRVYGPPSMRSRTISIVPPLPFKKKNLSLVELAKLRRRLDTHRHIGGLPCTADKARSARACTAKSVNTGPPQSANARARKYYADVCAKKSAISNNRVLTLNPCQQRRCKSSFL